MKALEVIQVTKTYQAKTGQPVQALKGISLSVEPGEIFGLLGPNGAGKTSLISIITGLEKATSGQVKIFGVSVDEKPLQTRAMVGVVPQEIVASGFFNLLEILKYHSGYYGLKNNEARINDLMKKLSLEPHSQKMMRQLSGGMKRRMMIAKALVHSPKLLLLDEPTAGVDVELRNQLWDFVNDLQREGVSIVLTTHYLQEAEALCKKVGIIHQGEIKYQGPTKDIIRDLTTKKIEIKLKNGDSKNIIVQNNQQVGEALANNHIELSHLQDIRIIEGSLEEAFVKVLRS